MILWQKENTESACKIGVAGDFLPAPDFKLPGECTWSSISGFIAPYFRDVDISVVNLECPVDVGNSKARMKMAMGGSFCAPAEVLNFLSAVKTGIVGIANNHIYDYGKEGLECTKRAVLAKKMVPIGCGRTLRDAPDVSVLEGPGRTRIGFWAAARGLSENGTRNASGVEAATRKRGLEALAEMKQQDTQLRVALIHAGLERTNRPDPHDVAFMDSLATLGFDVVAAAHSHRISGYKVVTRPDGSPAFCFYGLGSLLSGVMYTPLEREGILVVIALDARGGIAKVEGRPIQLEGAGWGVVPDLERGESISQRFLRCSAEISDGSYKRLFYEDTGKNLFRRQFRDLQVAVRQGGFKGLTQKLSRLRMRHLHRLLWKGFTSREYLPR
ncbi:MAG TPA: CapA family protein [Candidatus Acidoferrum sp.]|nr:CapA family protein [Candidatus Acidoferrum sp.]